MMSARCVADNVMLMMNCQRATMGTNFFIAIGFLGLLAIVGIVSLVEWIWKKLK